MALPIDSCRLYFCLRNRAYSEAVSDSAVEPGTPGVVEFDKLHEEPAELGLTQEQTRHALDRLVDAGLIHRLTPEQERLWHRASRTTHEDAWFVEPCDDLTAATILFGAA